LLIDGEHIELRFSLLRDVFMFTDKRLILIDIQGITGSRVEYKSLPYEYLTIFLRNIGYI